MPAQQSLIGRYRQLNAEEKIYFLLSLNRHWRRRLLGQLSNEQIADTLAYSDENDAVACLEILASKRRQSILKLLHDEKRAKLKLLLSFAPRTAGRLVDSNFIEISLTTPISQITQKVKAHYRQHNKPPTIIVKDNQGKICGRLPLSRLIIDAWQTPQTIKLTQLVTVHHTLDQEHLIEKVAGTSAKIIAVIDNQQRILGIIRTHDLLRVLEQEVTEDFYKFAGLPPEEHIFDSPWRSVRLRGGWLTINLLTALLDVIVISSFKEIVTQIVILAAFMPVVAGMGGNAGTQTLAVMVRGIATGEIKTNTAGKVILKEIIAGSINGIITGAIVGIIAFIWQGSLLLGVVLFLAMVINLIVAGLFGALVPLTLKRLNIDPAIASSIFITTATDVFGFLAFLFLAAHLLL